MGTLLLLVVFSAIFVLFADETTKFIKKIYKIYWLRVFGPLFIISWVWVWNDEFFLALLAWLRSHFFALLAGPITMLSDKLQFLMIALGLFVLASLPAYGLYWYAQRKAKLSQKMPVIALVYIFSWVFCALLIIV